MTFMKRFVIDYTDKLEILRYIPRIMKWCQENPQINTRIRSQEPLMIVGKWGF